MEFQVSSLPVVMAFSRKDCIPSRSWNKDLTRGELMAGKGYTVSLHSFIRGWFYGFNKHSL